MLLYYIVEISNCLDDSTKAKLVTVNSKDKDAINNIGDLVDLYVELDEDFLYEKIVSIRKIEPIHIQTNTRKIIGFSEGNGYKVIS